MEQTTHTLRPSFAAILKAQLVFLRAFFFPCGVNVDRHALHCGLPGRAVRQSTCGMLEEVPVPRKMSSIGLVVIESDSEDDAIELAGNIHCVSARWGYSEGITDTYQFFDSCK